jgi:CDP-diacylglycerol--serine O-phosphatidyltransferase
MKKRAIHVQKGIYLLPSFFTTAGLFCGFYAIIKTINILVIEGTDYSLPATLILFAAFFDGLDGRIARLTNTDSKFGVQYDSLSDLACFGIAPAILMYAWALKPLGRIGWLACFLFFVCGVLRLARFNVMADKISKKHFQGLPIPIAASLIASCVLFRADLPRTIGFEHYSILIMGYVLALLMVSSVKYRSFKDFAAGERKTFSTLVIVVLTIIVIAYRPEVVLFFLSLFYISFGVFEELLSIKKKKELVQKEEKDKI